MRPGPRRACAPVGPAHSRARTTSTPPPAPPPYAAQALIQQAPVGVVVLRRVEQRQPAVTKLGGERDVLRPFRGQVDRDALAQRTDARLERLAEAGAILERERVVRALAGDRALARPNAAQEPDVLAHPRQRLGERLAVPTLDDLWPRHSEAEEEPATR